MRGLGAPAAGLSGFRHLRSHRSRRSCHLRYCDLHTGREEPRGEVCPVYPLVATNGAEGALLFTPASRSLTMQPDSGAHTRRSSTPPSPSASLLPLRDRPRGLFAERGCVGWLAVLRTEAGHPNFPAEFQRQAGAGSDSGCGDVVGLPVVPGTARLGLHWADTRYSSGWFSWLRKILFDVAVVLLCACFSWDLQWCNSPLVLIFSLGRDNTAVFGRNGYRKTSIVRRLREASFLFS